MLTQAVLGSDNKELKKVELKKAIFGAPVRRQLIFDCVQGYLTNKRQGTVKAKFRGEVKGSSRKIYRQKGTGNARHGSIRANIFVGGGIAFPPRPRAWRQDLSQKARLQALVSALALRHKEGGLLLVDKLEPKEIKTKDVVKQLAKWGVEKGLLVIDERQEKLWKSVRNIPSVDLVTADNVNVLDILRFEKVVVTEKALHKLEKRFS
ncbi:MAG: 50S ribosomal protein L4 [Deltaproteobacteria bacterium RIFCSPLOWO2_01_44_7]|nr:MAG: 50S ribosomal protein L4 [Deltaproteobacteria bacterium RIFCSPHIGHO2_01_FULL_43_49]OGQ14968.1 MAG: 50S ribosomal protein L4 [Deltaproteobacteria bacterium RIFCSPHIGHO2_02_FULL_44_53]OGQ29529.1 MAG: 50S ribosomal protein L4 [Deltaproteobacteria bacterium RIFCSPHIGHO2_12_FULL_44_21]OGQ31080.1 MAG: 50S ribosomal protein L4 [Deltaproteobacteria bacterium RIFCSPLOWO2_01_FULL_45_74]OGQ38665.1 MAG: 50S ribosomal protein L4 [Deltaproteobacteria bacterium RIFCSPLOWO2_01_44_7]OGQ42682.1 MAG: 50S